MVVTTRSHHRLLPQEEAESLPNSTMSVADVPHSTTTTNTSSPSSTRTTEEQILLTLAKEQVKILPKFGGTEREDVLLWLQQVEEVFDRALLQPTTKYVAIQSYLVNAALKWFRFNKSRILDWKSFKTAITQAYQPSLHQLLAKLEKRSQLPDESVMEYYYDKLHLCIQADPQISSSMIIHHLTKGLNEHLIPHVIRRHPNTPDDFLTIAQDEEKIFTTLKDFSSKSTIDSNDYPVDDHYAISVIDPVKRSIDSTRRSNNRSYPLPPPQPLMNIPTVPSRPPSASLSRPYAPRYHPSSPSNRRCYSCYGFGHLAANCPSRKNV